jgi:glucose/arabinose dehydrogenase
VGLDARPANPTCVAPAKSSSNAGATIALQRAFPNLTFSQPLGLLQPPGDNSRWYVLQKTGQVRTFANTANVSSAPTALTLTVNSNSEGGLLGMAFHPSFATNRFVYVSFTEGSPMVSVIARFTANADGTVFSNRTDVLKLNQPYDNHKGGNIAFGPDGYLYIGFGDGGNGGDPQGHAQNTTDMLGDMLRIDVNGAAPYAIPPDNPFAGGNRPICGPGTNASSCPEIYASGLRNPWRWSFDSVSGELWVGDVGQGAREEIDRVARGGNYGWNCREGAIAYTSPGAACSVPPAGGFASPVHDYDRNQGFSVTGGYVYRGSALPALVGRYLFADYGSGKIWRLVGNGSGGFTSQELLDTSLGI